MASTRQKASSTPEKTVCPHCKKGEVRVKVELFLDIPFSLAHRLSKENLRLKDVKVEGANWPKEMLYCTHPGCGMIKRGKR